MEQIKKGDKKICYSDKQEIAVVQDPPGVPGDNKQGKTYDYAESLGKGMKEQVIIVAHCIEPRQNCRKKYSGRTFYYPLR